MKINFLIKNFFRPLTIYIFLQEMEVSLYTNLGKRTLYRENHIENKRGKTKFFFIRILYKMKRENPR